MRHANDRVTLLKYADAMMFAWPLGMGIARIGCFLTRLHPGRLSSLPFAVAYPGGARLDMGLIESALLLGYWIVMVALSRGREHFAGFFLIVGMTYYGVMRFILDFFRANDIPMADVRYLGLTPAQYGSIVLVVFGMYLFYMVNRGQESKNNSLA